MTEFRKVAPGVIGCDEGLIRLRGRTRVDVVFRGQEHQISSELLSAAMVILLHVGEGPADTVPTEPADAAVDGAVAEREALLAFVTRGLQSLGFTVDRVGTGGLRPGWPHR